MQRFSNRDRATHQRFRLWGKQKETQAEDGEIITMLVKLRKQRTPNKRSTGIFWKLQKTWSWLRDRGWEESTQRQSTHYVCQPWHNTTTSEKAGTLEVWIGGELNSNFPFFFDVFCETVEQADFCWTLWWFVVSVCMVLANFNQLSLSHRLQGYVCVFFFWQVVWIPTSVFSLGTSFSVCNFPVADFYSLLRSQHQVWNFRSPQMMRLYQQSVHSS